MTKEMAEKCYIRIYETKESAMESAREAVEAGGKLGYDYIYVGAEELDDSGGWINSWNVYN